MKRNLFATLLGFAVVGLLAGCADDPTASLRGGVAVVEISRTHVELDEGASLELEAWSRDAQGNYLSDLPTITSSDPATVSVEIDTVISGDPLVRTRFTVTAEGAGEAEITASAAGVSSDPTSVISFPLVFGGAISVDQSGANDILTLTSTDVLKFTDASTVTINEGQTYLVSRSADELVVQSLSLSALTDATVTVSNLLFLGESAISSLDAASPVNVRAEANEPANDDPLTSPVITPGFTAVGGVGEGGFDAADFFQIDLAAATDVTFTVAFPENTDIDLQLYDGALNFIDYSWYDNPEQIVTNLAAGTYYVEIYLYATDDPDPVWYEFSYTSP
ncbi:MAG: PPC domain-containing protein [Gemmatimonadales bacterium]|jgi:hypothetical protein